MLRRTVALLLVLLLPLAPYGVAAQDTATTQQHDHDGINATLLQMVDALQDQQDVLQDVQVAVVALMEAVARLQDDLAAQARSQAATRGQQANVTGALQQATRGIEENTLAIHAMQQGMDLLGHVVAPLLLSGCTRAWEASV